MMKICPKCGIESGTDGCGFSKNKLMKDGLQYYCKKCKNETSKKWRQENPEKVKEANSKTNKKWRQKNPEKVKEANKKWYKENTEKVRTRTLKWAKENPEKTRAIKQRRRARKQLVTTEQFLDSEIFERDNWICGICGELVDKELKYPNPMSAALDHIIPIFHFGSHTMDNVQLVHMSCNSRKGTKLNYKEI